MKNSYICDFYIIIYLVYNLQGLLYPSGSIISRFFLFLYITISLWYYFKLLLNYKLPSLLKATNVFFLLLVVYGLFEFVSGDIVIIKESGSVVNRWEYLKSLLVSFPPIFVFYYFSKTGKLTLSSLKKWSFVFLVFVSLYFYRFHQDALIRLSQSRIDDGVVNNGSYLFLSLLPLSLILKDKPILQLFYITYCLLFIILSAKRGAILIAFVCILLIAYYSFRSSSIKQKSWTIFASAILLFALYFFIQRFVLSSDFFVYRIESTLEGGSSVRRELYSFFYHHFISESDPLRFLFGNGANTTIRIGYNYAHNDWLEIAINQGLLGLTCYLFFWISFIRTLIRMEKSENRFALFLLAVILFFMSIVSMAYANINLYMAIILGFSLYSCETNTTKSIQ